MEDLIKLVSEKANITAEQAKQAVDTVMGFLKDKLPPDVTNVVTGLAGGLGDLGKGAVDGAGKAAGDIASTASNLLGGILGGKKD